MKNIYYSQDIINSLVEEIPLGTKVIMKVDPILNHKFIRGTLIKNDKNCIGIDCPKKLGGTFLSREAIEYIKILKKGEDKMSKKEQLLNELEQIKNEFKEKIENVQKQIEEENNRKECWTPRYEERYYLIDKLGRANYTLNRNGLYDKARIKNLNCFKTQEEAERVAFEQLLHRKLQRFAFENNEEEIDWKNEKQFKWCIVYQHESNCANSLMIDYCMTSKDFGQIYFTSKEIAKNAIERFKDDLFRYFTSDK